MGKGGDSTVLEKGSRMKCCWVVAFPSRQLVGHLQALQQARRGGGSVGDGHGKMGLCFLLFHILKGKVQTLYRFWDCERACLGM